MIQWVKGIIEKLRSNPTAFKIGILLLIVNPPLGWLGIAIGAYIYARTGKTIYITMTTLFYLFTWAMAIAGIILAGPRGVKISKETIKKILGKIKK